LAGETAAALAAASIFYDEVGRSDDAVITLFDAMQLFDMADFSRGTYVDHIPARDFYKYGTLSIIMQNCINMLIKLSNRCRSSSWSGYQDELVWAAAWLYKASKDIYYLDRAESLYNEFNMLKKEPKEFSWDDKVQSRNTKNVYYSI